MTAYKVIDNHKDLDGIGSFTHDQIDSHINNTPFVVASGSFSTPSSRTILAGQGIEIFDSGPGGSITISTADVNSFIPLMSWMETPVGNIDSENTIFKLASPPYPQGSLQLYENGVLLHGAGNDYYLNNDTFIMNYPPSSGSFLVATYEYRFAIPYGQFVSWLEIPTGLVDGTNKDFFLLNSPDPTNSLMLYENGILQFPEKDFTFTGSKITYFYPPLSGSKLLATYAYSNIPVIGKNTSWIEIPGGDIDGVNTIFSSSNVPIPQTAMMLFVNGVLQRQGADSDYIISGSIINMLSPPLLESNIIMNYPY